MENSFEDLQYVFNFIKKDEEYSNIINQNKEKLSEIKSKYSNIKNELLDMIEENYYYEIDEGIYIKKRNKDSFSYSFSNIEKAIFSFKDNYDKLKNGEIKLSRKRRFGQISNNRNININSDDDVDNNNNNVSSISNDTENSNNSLEEKKLKYKTILDLFDHTFMSFAKTKKIDFSVFTKIPSLHTDKIIKNDNIKEKYLHLSTLKDDIINIQKEKKDNVTKHICFRNSDLKIIDILKKNQNKFSLLYSKEGEEKKIQLQERKNFRLSRSLILDIIFKYVFLKYENIEDILSIDPTDMIKMVKDGIDNEKNKINSIFEVDIKTICPKKHDNLNSDDKENDNLNSDDDNDDDNEN